MSKITKFWFWYWAAFAVVLALLLWFAKPAHAADITRYINTASEGGDGTTNNTTGGTAAYASCAAAMQAEEQDLTDSGGDEMIFIASGTDADTTRCLIESDWTTGTTSNCITLKTDDSVSNSVHEGVYSTSSYRIENDDTNGAIFITAGCVIIDGIQLFSTGSSGVNPGIKTDDGSTNLTLRNIIYKGTVANNDNGHTFYLDEINASSGKVVYIYNNLIYDAQRGVRIFTRNNDTYYIANNLVADVGNRGFDFDLSGGTDTVTIKNNVCYQSGGNCYVVGSSATTTDFSTNMDDDGNDLSADTEAINSTTCTYENAASDDYRITSEDSTCKGTGLDLSGVFTTDYLRNTRDEDWDLGPHEEGATGEEEEGAPLIDLDRIGLNPLRF